MDLTFFVFQSDRNSLLVTQNYNILESAKNRNENDDSSPVHPLPERKKTGFDPFDPISVKLMTIGNEIIVKAAQRYHN